MMVAHPGEATRDGGSARKRPSIDGVRGTRLTALAAFFIALPVVGAACGDGEGARSTLPPIETTTTTTSTIATTTTYPEFYTIQPGETLGVIALKFGTTVEVLVEINGIRNRNDVQAGQKLKLPPNPALTTTSGLGVANSSTTSA